MRTWKKVCVLHLLLVPLSVLPLMAKGTASHAERCAVLAHTNIPASKIGKPTHGAVVESATFVPAAQPGNDNGELRKVLGRILPMDTSAPDIRFEVNLPSVWNGRSLQMGGGAYDGSLVTGLTSYADEAPHLPTPLAAGYVTLGGDAGHTGIGFDGTFALNDEALWNYGRLSIKKTHDAALEVVKAYYSAVPKRSYFIGGSQGGHEALIAAALYPSDYDGVVADFPAYNVTLLQLGAVQVSQALYRSGGDGWMNPVKVKLLTDAVYAACDSLDGASDGIISDVAACNARFNLDTVRQSLRCKDGKDTGDDCLSDAQIGAVSTIASPYEPGYSIGSMNAYPKWPILEGSTFLQGSMGTVRQPSNPPSGKEALMYFVASGITKFFITRNPDFDPLTFRASDWKAAVDRSAGIIDITSASLGDFQKKGGKIILIHGAIDDLISPYNSIAYYQRQLEEFGSSTLDSFLRFYLVPGFGHGSGVFAARYDSLGALQAWVESGKAPGTLQAVDGNPDARRSRPMCVYPAFPKFTGSVGVSLDDARNFSCLRSGAH